MPVCPTCRTGVYVLDTRQRGEFKVRANISVSTQWTMRKYGCPKCHRRYIGTEVFNPEPYSMKPIPAKKMKELKKEIIKKDWSDNF